MEPIGRAPLAKHGHHLVLACHRRLPRLVDPAEHATDGTRRRTSSIVGGTHPCLCKTSRAELSVEACRRPDERPLVVVHQGIHIAAGKTTHMPTRHRAVIAVVADAHAFVEVLAQHSGIGAHTHAMVMLRDLGVGVMQQGVTYIFHVDIVRLASVVAAASTFRRANADALSKPVGVGGHVAFVIDHLGHLVLHIGHALHGETTHKDLGVVVVAFKLPQPDVGASSIHGLGGDGIVVAHEQHIAQVLIGVIVMAENERLDLTNAVAANVIEVDQGRRSTRLVFPCHERLHGIKIAWWADDQHLALIWDKVVFSRPLTIVDETMCVHGIGLGCHLRWTQLAAHLGIAAVVARLAHGQRQLGINPQGLGDWIIGKRIDQDVLPTEIAKDVWFIQLGLSVREKAVLRVGLAITERYLVRVDLTAEIAF